MSSIINLVLGVLLVYVIFGPLPLGLQLLATWLVQRREQKNGQGVVASGDWWKLLSTVWAFFAGLVVWVLFLSWTPDQLGLPMGGPYADWQVFACGVGAVFAVVMLSLRTRWFYAGALGVVLGFTAGFALAWSFWAAANDSSGLWGAGLVFLFIGCLIGLNIVGLMVASVRAERARDQQAGR
ncbi:hypothetical protein [Corynebacterium urealyticum]|uniref:hypothetical protein n=1 Tax=Corynebacterium urealyticum TaxID=43771 RepID=UPI0002B3F743|nr:hypothetical protein [Corynebacterium urealyticum]AGE37433.1 hypothetical protein CU7111_1850 [Corynebacterium urealyticum DSM 7111]